VRREILGGERRGQEGEVFNGIAFFQGPVWKVLISSGFISRNKITRAWIQLSRPCGGVTGLPLDS
jgi:hypothetical protein